MSGSCSGRFSKLFCLLLSKITGFSLAFVLVYPQDVFADGKVRVTYSSGWGDYGGLQVELSGFSEGQNVDVTISFDSDAYASFNGDAAQVLSKNGGGERLRSDS